MNATALAVSRRMLAMRPTQIEQALSVLGSFAVNRQRPPVLRCVNGRSLPSGRVVDSLLEDATAVVFPDFFTADELTKMQTTLSGITWQRYGDETYGAFSQSWFAARACGLEQEYADRAPFARQAFDQQFPGLNDRILRFCSWLVGGEPVRLRDGWSGPGFSVLHANTLAGYPGDIHFDWEGFPADGLQQDAARCLTFVAMIAKPDRGGGLRVWNVGFAASPQAAAHSDAAQSLVVDYQLGDLVCFNGFDLHQIEPFHGANDRITLAFHMVARDGFWEIWF